MTPRSASYPTLSRFVIKLSASGRLRFRALPDLPHETCPTFGPWTLSHKADRRGAQLADGHYSRRKVGSPQFMPPGETVVLVAPGAVFGWWRPHPRSGLKAMNGYDGWTCSIFRRVSGPLASDMILAAELALEDKSCGPSGLLSYVWPAKVRSSNPGYCFQMAGYRDIGASADGRKRLFWKPWEMRGVAASGLFPPIKAEFARLSALARPTRSLRPANA